MFRYKLRTLLIVVALGPPLLAGGYFGFMRWREYQRQRHFDALIEQITKSIDPQSSGP